MKTKSTLSILMSLAVTTIILVGCSDYDNGFTEKELQFNGDFTREFGSFDSTQDWNLAERANVTVTTSERKDINVYTEKEGAFVLVGAFKNVSGTQKLEFDVIEDMQNLVVSDGDVALRAVVGGTVNFDDMSSVDGEVMGTRGGEDVNRNMWKSNGYKIPANITEAEWKAVVEEFSYAHYQAYNEVLVPWSEIFIQQVYKGEASYADAFNQNTSTASDKMNRLMVWDNSASEWSKQYDNSYIHVNDFNSGNQSTQVYADDDVNHEHPIIGITLMKGLDPSNCPTEVVTLKDAQGNTVTKNWVKQFMYHNSQSSEYKATYIMKRVTWTEPDGTQKSGTYLGFDFMSDKPEGQPANLNMDVTRDWIFNDWIIKLSEGLDVFVPMSELQNASPAAWILAGEDLGGGFDIDYNDVVVKVERIAGENKARVTPLAAGGTLASYLFFEEQCVGEIHQLLDASPARSGSYQPINLSGDLHEALQSVTVNVTQDWSLTEDISKSNNMGGFSIRVLPAGTEPMSKKLRYDDPAFDKATTVKAPQKGEAPYIICVPYAYKVTNYPAAGMSEATVWEWPDENVNIATVYEDFSEWARDKNAKRNWYSKHGTKGFVNTQKFTRTSFGVQPARMTAYEIVQSNAAVSNAVFQEEISPNGYTVCDPPVATLELKEGVTGINMAVGQTIDLLDYVDTNYPNSVYCSSDDYSAFTPTEAHKITCNIAGHTSTVHVKIATPTSVLNVDVDVNSGSDNNENQNDGNQDNQEEQQDEKEDVSPSGNGDAISLGSGQSWNIMVTSNGNGTYNISYGNVAIQNVSSLTVSWDNYNSNNGSMHITSPWWHFNYQSGAESGSQTLTTANLQSCVEQGGYIAVSVDNNPLNLYIQ